MNTGKPFPYEDIVHLQRPVGKNRARMSMIDRAAQFAPFAALTGYDAAIRESGRRTDPRTELDESERSALNARLSALAQLLPASPRITVTYYEADLRKEGGRYVTASGTAVRVDSHTGILSLRDRKSVV